MVGPSMIHYTKTFSSYMFLASSIVSQRRDAEKLRVFGTDGEKALIDAFSHEFPFALHLTCFNHVRRNIKDELSKLALPDDISTEILDDIFGKKVGSSMYEGLVDCEDVCTFDEKLELVLTKWRQSSAHSDKIEEFCSWLVRNKVDTIRHSMLRPVREDAGLGSPPSPFYTNASESVNNIIKRKVNYKRSNLPQFIQKMKELANEQDREVERAIIGRGKYTFCRQYEHLHIDESKWFRMSRAQKEKHIKKVMSISVSEPPEHCPTSQPCSFLSDIQCLSTSLNIPFSGLEAISQKATELLSTDGAIVPAPGHPSDSCMVLSRSGKRPHLVTPRKNGAFSCDDQCPQYQSSKLCSHIVAVAQYTHRLPGLVSAIQKEKRKEPNLSKLALTAMPRGQGRKGSKAPAKKRAAAEIENRYELSSVQSLQQIGQVSPGSVFPSCTISVGGNLYSGQATTFSTGPSNAYPPAGCPSPAPYHSYPSAYYGPCTSYQDQSTSFSNVPSQFGFYPEDPTAHGKNPFRLVFIFGNVSTCFGCHNKYNIELGPPHDLCIQHEEKRPYTLNGVPHYRFGNAYYHVNLDCVRCVWQSFSPSMLLIELQVDKLLTDAHRVLLSRFV